MFRPKFSELKVFKLVLIGCSDSKGPIKTNFGIDEIRRSLFTKGSFSAVQCIFNNKSRQQVVNFEKWLISKLKRNSLKKSLLN